MSVGHPIGPMGWGQANETIEEKHVFEGQFLERAIAEAPAQFMMRQAQELKPKVKEKFDALQAACGRGPNSCDMTLLDHFILGKRLNWFPQDIGSCVWSNTFRIIVARMMFEIALRGDPEEYFGYDEHGIRSIAPHCIQYGLARQIANMRGGDGLYCSPMGKSLGQGMLMCSTPKLVELMKAEGAEGPTNFPEPRNARLYRAIGDWKFNDALRPFLSNPVVEVPPVQDFDTHFELSKAFKPIFQCSGIAIRKRGKHKDGFTIHERDPNNSWAHNMGFMGHFYASDGTLWFRFSNKSWLNDLNPEGAPQQAAEGALPHWDDQEETFVYNIEADHLRKWYTSRLVDSMAIGEIDMPQSLPATI
jgi:hypothetical protein